MRVEKTTRFAGRSQHYGESPVHSQGQSIQWLRDCFKFHSPRIVVDLAAGAGHASLSTLSPSVPVIAVDLASDMLAEYSTRAKLGGFASVSLVHASASALPLADACASAIVCRLGIHHVTELLQAFAEVARILEPGGSFYLIEHYIGETTQEKLFMDQLLNLHDPSHAHTLDSSEYIALAKKFGLSIQESTRRLEEVTRALTVESWFNLAATPHSNRKQAQQLIAEIENATAKNLGFKAYDHDLYFDVPVNLLRFQKTE